MATATSGYNGLKFPLIQLDANVNYPNAANNIKKVTVEEWQDLLHHTHKLSEILDDSGEFLGGEGSADGGVSVAAFNELKETVQQQAQTIQTQAETIAQLQESLSQLINTVNNINNSNGIIIGDWDVTKPGIQDQNDNTIG